MTAKSKTASAPAAETGGPIRGSGAVATIDGAAKARDSGAAGGLPPRVGDSATLGATIGWLETTGWGGPP